MFLQDVTFWDKATVLKLRETTSVNPKFLFIKFQDISSVRSVMDILSVLDITGQNYEIWKNCRFFIMANHAKIGPDVRLEWNYCNAWFIEVGVWISNCRIILKGALFKDCGILDVNILSEDTIT